MTDWLKQLWKLRNSIICHLWTGGPEKAGVGILIPICGPENLGSPAQVQRLENPERPIVLSPSSSSKASEARAAIFEERRGILHIKKQHSALHPLSPSFWALMELYNAHLQCSGLSPLLNGSMLVSSRKVSGSHLEITFYQFSEHPLAQSSWHIKLTITDISSGSRNQDLWVFLTFFILFPIWHFKDVLLFLTRSQALLIMSSLPPPFFSHLSLPTFNMSFSLVFSKWLCYG